MTAEGPPQRATAAPEQPSPGSPRHGGFLARRDAFWLIGLFLFFLLFFAPVLFGPTENCLGRPNGDARSQFYPWRDYAFSEIRAGRFPLWNPYEFLGMPFLASLQSGLFYPTSWFCAFLPTGLGVNIGLMAGLYLSALFTYLWCRRLGLSPPAAVTAGATYAFGAPQLLRIFEGHWSFLASMTWIPALFLCAESLLRSRRLPLVLACGGVAVAMQLFGGNPQYALYGGIALVLYFLIRLIQERPEPRRLLRLLIGFGGMYALGVVLSAAQMVPALEFLGRSSRQGQLSLAWISQYSLVPESLVTLFVPDAFGSDITAEYWGRFNLWEMSAYVGIVPLGAALLGLFSGRRRIVAPVGALAVLMLLLALGRYTPLQAMLYRAVPGFDLFRVWARFLCPFSLMVAVLAAVGVQTVLDRASDSARGHGRPLRIGLIVTAIPAALMLLLGLALLHGGALAFDVWSRFMKSVIEFAADQRLYLGVTAITREFVAAAMNDAGLSLLRSGMLLGGVVAVGWMALRSRGRRAHLAGVLVVLLALDVWTFGRRYMQTFDPNETGFTTDAAGFLNDVEQPFRYSRNGDFRFPVADGMRHGFTCLEGIQPNAPRRFRDVFWAFQGRPPDTQTTFYMIYNTTPLFRMLNLRFTVQQPDRPPLKAPGLIAGVYEDDRVRIDELPAPLPRAWLVHRAYVEPDEERTLARLLRLNARTTALLTEPLESDLVMPGEPEAMPRVTDLTSNCVRIETEPKADALLVMSDLHYPGWEAKLDGRPVPVLRANYLMRAVRVPAGPHVVEFRYAPDSFRIGLLLSCIGVVLLAALLCVNVIFQRREKGSDNEYGTGEAA